MSLILPGPRDVGTADHGVGYEDHAMSRMETNGRWADGASARFTSGSLRWAWQRSSGVCAEETGANAPAERLWDRSTPHSSKRRSC